MLTMAARRPIEKYGSFQPDFGLKKGMHTNNRRLDSIKEGKSIVDIIDSCYLNGFITVRGFTPDPSIPFDPKVVLVASLDDESRKLPEQYQSGIYYAIRIQNIILGSARPKSVIIFEGQRPNYDLCYDRYEYNLRFVEDELYLKNLREAERLGISVWDVDPDINKRRRAVFAREILKAANEGGVRYPKVFVSIDLIYLMCDGFILKELEKNNKSYLLLAPRNVFSSKNPRINLYGDQNEHERQLKIVASANFHDNDQDSFDWLSDFYKRLKGES